MAEKTSNRIAAARSMGDEVNNPLLGKTIAQVEAYIDANVTNIATAREALKKAARLLIQQEKRINALEEFVERAKNKFGQGGD